MNDEIVEEIHQIRKKTYEETKNMSPKELIEYYHNSSLWVQERIAACRPYLADEETISPQKKSDIEEGFAQIQRGESITLSAYRAKRNLAAT